MSTSFNHETQGVSMLKAFKRAPESVEAECLEYPYLEAVAADARQKENALLDEFWAAEVDSVYEEDRARQAAMGYFVLTGLQLHTVPPASQALIAKRFTQHSIELYGEPEKEVVQQLISQKLNKFKDYTTNPNIDAIRLNRIVHFYEQYAEGTETINNHELFSDTRHQMAVAVKEQYNEVLAVFDSIDPGHTLTPREVYQLFNEAKNILGAHDTAWKDWDIELTDNTSMATNIKTKRITIGERTNNMTPLHAKSLFGHEVLVHAGRAVSGSKTGNAMMEHGLPGSLDAEEGVAVFIQYALSETIGEKRTDYYIDTALALGTLGNPPLARAELQRHYLDRLVVDAQAAGDTINEEKLNHTAWRYVNRIYRGSLGNDIIAVNTKDLAYAIGFIKIGKYIEEELASGTPASQVLSYLLSGKFDPTNERHVQFIETLK